jgi:cytochrome c
MRRGGLGLLAAAGLASLALPAMSTAQQAPAPASAAPGERAFRKCTACHALGDDDEGAQGPSLKGILGRPVASRPGYAYSAAMRAHAARQPRWSRAALDAFLADPQGTVPDNEMGFFGIKDPAERAALIDYLAAQ